MALPTTLRHFTIAAALLAVAPLHAQIEFAQEDGYVEMTAEEFRSLIGKMQRLRAQRAQQVQAMQQQEQRYAATQRTPQPQYRPQYQPPQTLIVPQGGSSVDNGRLAELERQTAMLAEEIRLLRQDLYARSAPRAGAVEPTRIDTVRVAQVQPRPTEPYRQVPPTNTYDTDARTRYERQLDDERRRYDRDLRDERDRIRDLEREIASLRGRDYDRGRDTRVVAPSVIPVPTNNYRPDTVVRNVPGVTAAELMLMRQQDSLANALARLRAEMARQPTRDTMYLDRPMVVRDTIRKTDVVTKTVVEDRVDLAAVLFAHDSSVLDATAENQIQSAVQAYRREADATLLLRGFASRTGSVDYNQALSTRRALAVRDRLTAAGVPADHIRVIGNGIDPGTDLAEARRVEIQLLRKPNP